MVKVPVKGKKDVFTHHTKFGEERECYGLAIRLIGMEAGRPEALDNLEAW